MPKEIREEERWKTGIQKKNNTHRKKVNKMFGCLQIKRSEEQI